MLGTRSVFKSQLTFLYTSNDHLEQGSPTPRPWTSIVTWPVRTQAALQEVSGRQASKASSAAPHRSPWLALPPEPSPPPIEKLSSTKPVPSARKFGDR